jgi:hypothetical protein
MAFRTITNLTEGASAFQQSYLPGWKGKNANSLEENGIVFTDTLASWIKKGFVSGPFFFDPVEDFRSNTMQAIVQKDKVRPVMNLSAPEGKSYNDNIIEYSSRKVTMATAKKFAYTLRRSGKGSKMSKYDMKDAYKNIPIKSSDLRLQGFSWLGKKFIETNLAFGSTNAVAEFDDFGGTILSINNVISQADPKFIFRTLDDVPVIMPANSDINAKFGQNYRNLCKSLDIPLAMNCPKLEKAFENSTTGTVLGLRFNTKNMHWYISNEKLEKILDCIYQLLSKKLAYLSQIQSATGLINNLMELLPIGKSLRLPLYLFLASFKDRNKVCLRIPSAVQQDLLIWANIAKSCSEGMPIPTPPHKPPISALVFTSDAAGLNLKSEIPSDTDRASYSKLGVASVGSDRDQKQICFASRLWWPATFIYEKCDSRNHRFATKSSTLEAIGLLLPFISTPNLLRGKSVILLVDNMSLVWGWKKGHVKHDYEASIMLRALNLLSIMLSCQTYVEHLPRMSSPTAILTDHLSRESSTSVEDQKLLDHHYTKTSSQVLTRWLENPKVDWTFPTSLMLETEMKINLEK